MNRDRFGRDFVRSGVRGAAPWLILGPLWFLSACALLTEPPRITADFLDVTVGERHTCALTSAGGVKCWGLNHDGQLGDGRRDDRSGPVDVHGLTGGVKAIAAGWRHTCAVTTLGAVQCWGNNHDGQLGDGSHADNVAPQGVSGIMARVTAITAGERHTCALTVAGGVKCWGNNHDGELGDGTKRDHLTPMDVQGLSSGVTAIAAGWRHTCALLAAGGVKCWGNNHDGQLGNGTEIDSATPVDVRGLSSGAIAIAARWRHTCALMSSGGVKCWGGNHHGELGDGTRFDRNTPTDVIGLTSGAKAIASGWRHICAVLTNGAAKCWGSNHEGQLGDGTGIDRLTPVDVTTVLQGVTAIAAGGQHTCALMQGRITCWGENEDGQLGDGTFKSTLAAKGEAGF